MALLTKLEKKGSTIPFHQLLLKAFFSSHSLLIHMYACIGGEQVERLFNTIKCKISSPHSDIKLSAKLQEVLWGYTKTAKEKTTSS